MKQSNLFLNLLMPLTLAILLLLSGCSSTAKLSVDVPPTDLLSEYYELGVPTVNKNWTPDEYVKTIGILLEQNEQKALDLPSTKNNALKIIDKITDYNGYWFFESTAISYDEKILINLSLLESLKELMLVYNLARENDGQKLKYSYGTSNCYKAMLNVIDKQLELLDIFLENNPGLSDVQKEGLAQLKRGINTIISGTFVILKDEYADYNQDDICSLGKAFFEFYNKNRYRIDDDTKKEFDNSTKKLNTESPLECITKVATLK